MKKVYIVKRGDVIHQASSNLKAAYDCLVSHQTEMDVNYLRSYMQLTRIFKKVNHYYVPSNSGPRWEILLLHVFTQFINLKP
ncbi:MAG: hypothetical protein ACE5IW_10225 [bacterium]